ncbi:hypothetical protein AAVH_26125 [Aphelenchoides avenae]|nr:hypothetical protein AAVH_26125 [Aphelenchus avenae]
MLNASDDHDHNDVYHYSNAHDYGYRDVGIFDIYWQRELHSKMLNASDDHDHNDVYHYSNAHDYGYHNDYTHCCVHYSNDAHKQIYRYDDAGD